MRLDLLILLSILFICALVWQRRRANNSNPEQLPYPPGPPRKFLIGNALDFPRLHAWFKFTEWKKQYGDIVYTEAMGKPILVLNSIEVVNDLIDKRASIYTNRPEFVVAGELIGINEGMPMLKYGPMWKKHRRLANTALSIAAVKKYHHVQTEITAIYLKSLIEVPKEFASQLRLATGRIVMNVTYGLSASTPDSLYITEAEECLDIINRASMPGAFLVDLVPALKHLPTWFPGTTFHKLGREGYHKVQRLITRPFNNVKDQITAGTALPSLTADCLANFETGLKEAAATPEEKDHIIKWTAGVMYGAGGESTYATIMNFILAMSLYPEVLKKAQAEADSVVGYGRLPTLQDRSSLPYIDACIKEVMRWRPVLPVSIARASNQPDFYNGYYIPEGTIVVPNVWAIAEDHVSGIPTTHFAPERHMPEHVKQVPTDPYQYAFGFGRRICPGRFLGDNSIFLLLSAISATMDISKELDVNGKEITANPAYSGGLVAHPHSFPVRIKPRSADVVSLVNDVVGNIN